MTSIPLSAGVLIAKSTAEREMGTKFQLAWVPLLFAILHGSGGQSLGQNGPPVQGGTLQGDAAIGCGSDESKYLLALDTASN